MQTPKARKTWVGVSQKPSPRSTSSDMPLKTSPRASSSDGSQKISPQVVRQLKTPTRDSDQPASSSTRAPKDRSPKVSKTPVSELPFDSEVISKKYPKASKTEKKRPSKVSELENQISQLENDLKTVKEQLSSAEASKKQAEIEAEESNQQLSALSSKLEESQKLLLAQSISEKNDVIEICNNAEEQDETLLVLNEIKQLKLQLEMVAQCEATQTKNSESAQTELNKLKENLGETVSTVEDMKKELTDCKDSEARAKVLVGETLMQLEAAKKTVESLRSDGYKSIEAFDVIASELDQSRAHVTFLEELVGKLKSRKTDLEIKQNEDTEKSIEAEATSARVEVEELRQALKLAEMKYNEEQSRNAEQVRAAYEMMEQIKSMSSQREAELESKLKRAEDEIEELKANMMDKETELQGISDENEQLTIKLKKELDKSWGEIENLRANLMDKETELQYVSEENETLKLKIKEMKTNNVSDEVASEVEAARIAEQEALMKVGYMTEEVEKSNRRTARMAEQLEAAQATNADMETELRRLKVQSDQWRKAAEAAAAMLSLENNGKLMERTGSMDSNYSPRMGKIGSPYGDDVDEDGLKKKNANMLRRLGVLWKKPQK